MHVWSAASSTRDSASRATEGWKAQGREKDQPRAERCDGPPLPELSSDFSDTLDTGSDPFAEPASVCVSMLWNDRSLAPSSSLLSTSTEKDDIRPSYTRPKTMHTNRQKATTTTSRTPQSMSTSAAAVCPIRRRSAGCVASLRYNAGSSHLDYVLHNTPMFHVFLSYVFIDCSFRIAIDPGSHHIKEFLTGEIRQAEDLFRFHPQLFRDILHTPALAD